MKYVVIFLAFVFFLISMLLMLIKVSDYISTNLLLTENQNKSFY